MEHPTTHEEPWWLDKPENRTKIFYGVALMWAGFGLAGALPYEHHPYIAHESFFAFQGVYGLVCCIGLVLAARWLRTFLMRDEDYYDE